jgi:sugar lactone lactonase YvrE
MNNFSISPRILQAAFATFAAVLASAANPTELQLPGTRVFPESITSTTDGTLIIGSLGHGNILRAAPGKGAEEWIKPGANGLSSVLGVFADEKSSTLWVCSNNLDGKGTPTALKSFDLKSGAAKGSYPLPGEGPLCNDIAVSADGTAYVADTRLSSVLMLKRGGAALEIAAKDPKLAGADGLAFGQKNILYVNSVTANKLLRLDLDADGKAKSIVELKLSRPVAQPDGMRAIGTDRLILAEGAGKMDVVTVQGNDAQITTLKEGMENTPGVTVTRGMAWVVEGKLNYRNDEKLKDKDPGAFKMYAVPLPKK